MRHLTRSARWLGGFTLIELLTVMAVIAILAGLILSISGFANKKGALARAQAEIQALSAACESYKADNGTYPHQALAVSGSIPSTGTIPSDAAAVDPRVYGNSQPGSASPSTPGSVQASTAYGNASLELYEALSGDLMCTGTGGGPGVKNYIADLRPDTLGRTNMSSPVSANGSPPNVVYYLSDPFGNSYGYSTANSTAIASGSTPTMGYNPTFDLWCTGGSLSNPLTPAGTTGDPALGWVKNW